MDISKLDKVFSEYIRRMDADEYGRVKCCTCNTVAPWAEMDCGHWRRRNNMATRFDKRNCHAQCKKCNQFSDGMFTAHKDYIINRHGLNAAHELYLLSRQAIKFTQYEINQLVKEYKQKIKEL